MTLSIMYGCVYGINHTSLKTVEGQPENPEVKDNLNDDVGDTNSSPFSSAELFSKVKQSVVQIAYVVDISDKTRAVISGSGFLYDKNGHIVTNYHVIAGGSQNNLDVTFPDGILYHARVVGGDPLADLAVLKLEQNIPPDKLVPLPLGNSTSLRIGKKVVAVGDPFGLSGSMTTGIISGLDRRLPSAQGDQSIPGLRSSSMNISSRFIISDIIQTNAVIDPGDSGGPLLNTKGQVIGINTAIFSNTTEFSGFGFAIPSNTIMKIVPSLIATGVYLHPIWVYQVHISLRKLWTH